MLARIVQFSAIAAVRPDPAVRFRGNEYSDRQYGGTAVAARAIQPLPVLAATHSGTATAINV